MGPQIITQPQIFSGSVTSTDKVYLSGDLISNNIIHGSTVFGSLLSGSSICGNLVSGSSICGNLVCGSIVCAGSICGTFYGNAAGVTATDSSKLALSGGTITGDLNVTGTITATGSALSDLNASNISLGTLSNNRLPSFISVPTISATSISAISVCGSYNGSGANLINLNASNISSGTLLNTRLSAVLSAACVCGAFYGPGTNLTGLNASNISTGTLDNLRLPSTINVTNICGSLFGSGANVTSINASNISSGTLNSARLPSIDASLIASGTLNSARLPSIDASLIGSGTLNNARLPATISVTTVCGSLCGSGAGVTSINASNISSGTLNNNQLSSIVSVCNVRACEVCAGAICGTFYGNAAGVTGTDSTKLPLTGGRICGSLVVDNALESGNAFIFNQLTARNIIACCDFRTNISCAECGQTGYLYVGTSMPSRSLGFTDPSLTVGGLISGVSIYAKEAQFGDLKADLTSDVRTRVSNLCVLSSAEIRNITVPSQFISSTISTSGNIGIGVAPSTNISTLPSRLTVCGSVSASGDICGRFSVSNTTGTLAISNGGTGASTQQTALNNLAGSVGNGLYLKGNGSNVTMSAPQATDLQGVLNISQGGTGKCVSRSSTLTNLGGSCQITIDAGPLGGAYNGGSGVSTSYVYTLSSSDLNSYNLNINSITIPSVTSAAAVNLVHLKENQAVGTRYLINNNSNRNVELNTHTPTLDPVSSEDRYPRSPKTLYETAGPFPLNSYFPLAVLPARSSTLVTRVSSINTSNGWSILQSGEVLEYISKLEYSTTYGYYIDPVYFANNSTILLPSGGSYLKVTLPSNEFMGGTNTMPVGSKIKIMNRTSTGLGIYFSVFNFSTSPPSPTLGTTLPAGKTAVITNIYSKQISYDNPNWTIVPNTSSSYLIEIY